MGAVESESHGTTLINYGTCLGNSGRFDEAAEMFSPVRLKYYQSSAWPATYRMAALYNNMSWIAQERGELQDAEDYLNKAVFLLRTVDDSEGEQASYTNLANIYWAQGKLSEAKVMLIKSSRYLQGKKNI